eukprot:1832127-Ditylum_brightwellii.AAC.1
MLEFVAARDIDDGEEIFINYGKGWEKAWDKYVKDWEPDPYDQNYVPLSTLNEHPTVLTSKEQETHPYPEEVFISCYFKFYSGIEYKKDTPYKWIETEDLFNYQSNSYPCTILSRDESNHYTVKLDKTEHILWNLPRKAIEFSHHKYMSDQFIISLFRHEMEIPEEMFPEKWMDR